jgi:hypothetical protein
VLRQSLGTCAAKGPGREGRRRVQRPTRGGAYTLNTKAHAALEGDCPPPPMLIGSVVPLHFLEIDARALQLAGSTALAAPLVRCPHAVSRRLCAIAPTCPAPTHREQPRAPLCPRTQPPRTDSRYLRRCACLSCGKSAHSVGSAVSASTTSRGDAAGTRLLKWSSSALST